MPELTRKQVILGAALAILLIVAVVEYLYIYGPLGESEPSVEELQNTAMKAPEVNEREKAVLQLGNKGRVAIPQLREVLRDTREPEVKAAAVRSLGNNFDYQSVPDMLDALEDPTPLVRARAHAALVRMLGVDAHFDPHAPKAERDRLVRFYRGQWESLKNSPAMRAQEKKINRIMGPVGGQ